ncbi:MAG: flagellar filament capping protein FliD [Oxalicibacterium faecigallinarum]|uniref:flagellar filament capping protein FliD n=1 Tax=Oxalicibacterium faecigallinarum TaxID=573741 RepID=UPI002809B60C|nr:flagellar filament capping protein FliD [Oxalicibacterium faecigallinarum]MDQ7969950.1 flagellar filament capping protein FliD [Oxalicibacterium faecigallinarum]
MASITSSTGLGSGLEIDSIISQLMAVEQKPLAALAKKEASYQAKLSAYGTLNSAVSSFQSAMATLGKASTFEALKTSVADPLIYTAKSATNAIPGTYQVNVTQLAQAQTLATSGQTSETASIGSGTATTISFQFGSITGGTLTNGVYSGATFTQDAEQATGSITINSSNNSLQGIRDAINAANMGVTATLVSDGSATPDRLVLTSTKTGESSSMKITVEGDSALQNLLEYDPTGTQNLTQQSAAQDTKLTVNGLEISSKTNSVSEAIQGVTLDVLKVGSSSMNITRDTSAVETGVNNFVKAYNELNTVLSGLMGYNATTQTAGALNGDSTARSIQEQVRKMLTSSLDGLSNTSMSLSKIGVAFQKDGSLAVDSGKLNKAMTDNYGDIASLFATVGKATDSLVNFTNSSNATKAGSYAINVTRMATQASLTGTVNLNAGNTTITPNTAISVMLDGVTSKVYLTEGSYNAKQLAAMVQSAINGTAAFKTADAKVTATIDDNGNLKLVSDRYGSASKITVNNSGGTSVASFLGTSRTGTEGVDVAGTIGGLSATGSGQFLTGVSGDVGGLKLEIVGGTTGSRGTIDFSQGFADRLNKLASSFIGTDGKISALRDGLNASIKDLTKRYDAMEARLTDIEARYRKQFSALDVMIASMQSTGDFLTQQLEQIKANSKS